MTNKSLNEGNDQQVPVVPTAPAEKPLQGRPLNMSQKNSNAAFAVKTPQVSSEKKVYFFGDGSAEGQGSMKTLLGGKGANLAEMTSLGVPVPPGFTITTEVCSLFYQNDQELPESLRQEILQQLDQVQSVLGKTFGDSANPLLVSVRSGAPVSMPGMMDTILNLGLNDQTVQGLISESGDERFAFDSYRRFIQMYGNVVLEMEHAHFEHILEALKEERDVEADTDLVAADLKCLVAEYKAKVKEVTGNDFPEDPNEQLWGAITAVFRSWMNKRAIEYRRINNIPADWGTAVNVQSMVFGNMGETSATGVAFTRDPSTGQKIFFGEYLVNAQGEDVVAGIRTPMPINIEGKKAEHQGQAISMEEVFPGPYAELVEIYNKLESHYRDMQDIEFTVEKGKLWLLQTRNGKRTAQAALKIAVDMVKEGVINEKEALLRLSPEQLDQLLHPRLDPSAEKNVITKGLPASPGAACGQVVFTSEDAAEFLNRGQKVILVRLETSPEDIHGMNISEGILTARGGMTSHAAVVARGMGKCCVVGCGTLKIDEVGKTVQVNDLTLKEGDWLTLDGTTGEVILGQVPTVQPELSGEFETVMKWVDDVRQLRVRTNADTAHDSATARSFGAEGIGLCRTEHMFFAEDRIQAVREMILSSSVEERSLALEKILPMQRGDFIEIFKAMQGFPVTIRFLDPPLHEFLPHTDEEIADLAGSMNVSVEHLQDVNDSLKEFNPMLGHRGCRLGVTFPEIYDMQARAVMEAACDVRAKEGFEVVPEIMIPLVGHVNELKFLRERVEAVCSQVQEERGLKFDYLVGTMIELPRAALTADQIAEVADFFSFGTNDLTQTTFGLSRDDSQKFLTEYVERGILENDPFVSLDQAGVGQLVEIGLTKGKSARPNLKVGICGEHGGDPESVVFCHNLGLDYVSCSPFRVPIAKLSAAQAVLKNEK